MNLLAKRIVAVPLVIISLATHALSQTADEQSCAQSSPAVALTACTKVIKAAKDPIIVARAHFNRGLAQELSGAFKKAVQDYSKAIELNPKYSAPHNNLGILYQRQGKLKLAIQQYEKAVAIDPNNAYALNSRGRFYLVNSNDAKKAMVDFNKAIKINSKLSISYINRGFAYESLGKNEAAIADFQMALKLGVPPQQDVIIRKEIQKLKK